MTRILALVTDAYGGRGGIAQAARDVVEAFAADSSVSAVDVLPRHQPDPTGPLPAKVTQRRARSDKLGYVTAAMRAAARRPDIVFCNHLFMAPLATLLARRIGAKSMIQLHGIEIWQKPIPARRRALEAADLLLCVSRDTRARVLSQADVIPERAIVLNNTVEARFEPGDRTAARAKFELGPEFAILTVGRLAAEERYKGHDLVISALPRLKSQDGRRVIYLIAGEGSDRPRLEAAARDAGVADRVRFLGRVPIEDLPDLYRAADLFALLSSGEGFGIAFIEAMATGTPAVGLAIGGAPDALGDGELGTLLNPEDDAADGLAALIVAPRTSPELLASRVRARFGVETFRSRVAQAIPLAR